MSRLIQKRIKGYFKSKGLDELMNALEVGLPGPPVLAFKDSHYITVVFPLAKEELRDRNALLGALVRCTSLSGKANRVYLVLPRAYSSSIDAELLREQGIGLLTFDEKRLTEVLPPRTFDITSETASREVDSLVKDELTYLRERVNFLERALDVAESKILSLQDEFKGIKRELESSKRAGFPTQRIEQKVEVKRERKDGELPSFLVDNPWLEILVQRGKE